MCIYYKDRDDLVVPKSQEHIFPAFLGGKTKLPLGSPACLVELAKVFSVSTDYLLGIESLERVNVSGLDSKEVALLTELADMLRNKDHK